MAGELITTTNSSRPYKKVCINLDEEPNFIDSSLISDKTKNVIIINDMKSLSARTHVVSTTPII